MAILTPEQLTGRVSTHVQAVSQPSCMLHPQAARAFIGLAREAAGEGIELAASSSFRAFERQLAIWNAKFTGHQALLDRDGQPLDVGRMDEEQIVRAILAWSALPGASRHHWGSDLDVYDRAALPAGTRLALLPGEYAAGGPFAHLAEFLARRAGHFGFYLPYDRDRGGVRPEPWHLSFAPLAAAALPDLTVELLADTLALVPLAGAAVVRRLLPEIHERYVCRIAPAPRRDAAAPCS